MADFFAALAAEVSERPLLSAGGGSYLDGVSAENREQADNVAEAAAAQREPIFAVSAKEGHTLTIRCARLAGLPVPTVAFHALETETLFSQRPFEMADSSSSAAPLASVVAGLCPTATLRVAVSKPEPEGEYLITVRIPPEVANKFCIVSLAAGPSLVSHATHTPLCSGLAVSLAPRLGRLCTSAPAYVKVYAKLQSGEVVFWRDGFSSQGSGEFRYAAVSTRKLEDAARFAILVCARDGAAQLFTAGPPARQ
jgi:hypothetical protein